MTDFDQSHSLEWLEMMQAYQKYKEAVFYWAKKSDEVKYRDLFMELGHPVNSKERDLHRRLLVTRLLSSTEMWDVKAILLIWDKLVEAALTEQEEVAAYARMALKKIKGRDERLRAANKTVAFAKSKAQKEDTDCEIFYNGCLLLQDLKCREHFIKFAAEYKDFIYLASGLDEDDLEEMGRFIPVEN